ncbi:MAG: DUF2087 domain-containing protein [Chthonomonas sp.]|nr:DUF2087 domain-containing protein [Chthonomonas sp.]
MKTPTLDRYFDEAGRLKEWPSRHRRALQIAALHWLVGKFDAAEVYHERAVSEIIKRWHTFDDHALLRREMIDLGLLARDPLGTEYRVVTSS